MDDKFVSYNIVVVDKKSKFNVLEMGWNVKI